MSVNVGLDGRGRYHKRWTAFGLGCGAFKLPWEPFFDAHIMPKKGWISSLDCSLSGIGRHARLGMVWGFNILGLFRIDGKNTVSERFKNKRDLICISLEHITCRAGEDPVFIFNYV